jgi:hypothetical protein
MRTLQSRYIVAALLWALVCVFLRAADTPGPPGPPVSPSRAFSPRGEPSDESFFPIAVWLQDPRNAARFQAAGINLYIGLWRGPTPSQLADLRAARMPVICDQNAVALEHKDDPIIAGWMHGDEPDNAQSLGEGRGYGPPVPPGKIVGDYQRLRAADPSRPVLLNLGQGVAWDNYIGRGVRRNHPEDYPEYVQGCDIASFDIYPVVHDAPEVAGKLEFVASGVERLVGWTHGRKPVWSCIECTHISNPAAHATPAQVRAEVWMALVRGARGLIYFVHQFKPVFREAALLDDPEMLEAVTAINRQVRELAPVLNAPGVVGALTIRTSEPDVPIAGMLRRRGKETYLFVVNLRARPTRATFTISGGDVAVQGEVLGESRRVSVQAGSFSDEFPPYAVHRYRLSGPDASR